MTKDFPGSFRFCTFGGESTGDMGLNWKYAALLPVLLLGACDRDVPLFKGYRTRSEILGGGTGVRMAGPKEEAPAADRDTLIYVCGVEWDGDYDWQRDTASGEAPGKIVLFVKVDNRREGEGFRRVLEIPAGPGRMAGTETDRHHLLGGHIYTEKVLRERTVLCRDGVQVLDMDGKWMLCGLLGGGQGPLKALWMDRSGSGIRLTEDAGILMERGGARPYGSLLGPGPGRTGALHADGGGSVSFAFFEDVGGIRINNLWQDGKTVQIAAEGMDRIFDVRIVDGQTCILGEKDGVWSFRRGGLSRSLDVPYPEWMEEGWIADAGGDPVVCGTGSWESILPGVHVWTEEMPYPDNIYPYPEALLLGVGPRVDLVWYGPGNYLDLSPVGGSPRCVRCYFRYPSGSSVCGESIALSLTGRDDGQSFLWLDGQMHEVPLDGCLTGVEHVIMEKE